MSIFIIAEIGINHNGNLDMAKHLIRSARECGCNAVKFQKRDINLVYTKEFLDSLRESPWGNTQRAQKEGLEFGLAEYTSINTYCNELGIDWFASAWDINSLKFLDQFDCKYSKVASAMLAYPAFLQAVAERKKHTFISTAMSSIDMITEAVNIFRDNSCEFTLLHCVGTYPMKAEDANLRTIHTLQETFHCPVGYSGHESGLAVTYAAVGMGITALERHITLDRAMYGSDQAASLEIAGLRMMVGTIRKMEISYGDGIKRITPAEQEIANKLRAHIKVG